jgi:hypothetical protein
MLVFFFFFFFFFFHSMHEPTTRSEAKLCDHSNFSVGDQGLVFRPVYKIKLKVDIKDVTSSCLHVLSIFVENLYFFYPVFTPHFISACHST